MKQNDSSNRASDPPAGTIKLIGIGQSLRGDDAAGLTAVRLWQESYANLTARQNVQVELVELPGIGLLNLLEGCRMAILVDAMRSGTKTGTVRLLEAEQVEAFTQGSGSAHGWGVAETLTLGKQVIAGEMPEKLFLIGIEAGDLAMGDNLSAEVRQALPEAICLIEQVLQENKAD